MSNQDQFVQQLQRQPHRALPPEWRREILDSARKAASPRYYELQTSLSSKLPMWLQVLLWPHPRAWAGLALLWLVALFLNFEAREPAQPGAALQVAPPSRELRELLQQQERLLAELAGPFENRNVKRQKSAMPRPRSQKFGESTNVEFL
jgi:hypothetical protein